MTDDLGATERTLRTVLADRAERVTPTPDPYGRVRRGAHRRRVVLASAAAATAVAVGVPVGAATLRPVAAPPPPATGTTCADPTPAPSPRPPVTVPELPAQDGALGSLAGDRELVGAALREGYATLLTGPLPDLHTLDPGSARVNLIERVGDQVVAVVSARTPDFRLRGIAWVTGPDAARLRGGPVRGVPGPPDRFPTTVTGEVCGRHHAAVMALPGTTGTLTGIADVTADGRVVRSSQRVPFRPDGSAVVAAPAGRIALELSGGQSEGLNGDVTDRITPSRYLPSEAEIARAVAAAPGTADDRRVAEMVRQLYPNGVELPQSDLRIHRKAVLGDRTVILASVALPSGARYVWVTHRDDDGGTVNPFGGIVPAGAFDRSVIAVGNAGLGDGSDFLIVHAKAGVRAEVVRTGGTEQVAMQSGSAVVPRSRAVTQVRVWDVAGTLVGDVAPYEGVTLLE